MRRIPLVLAAAALVAFAWLASSPPPPPPPVRHEVAFAVRGFCARDGGVHPAPCERGEEHRLAYTADVPGVVIVVTRDGDRRVLVDSASRLRALPRAVDAPRAAVRFVADPSMNVDAPPVDVVLSWVSEDQARTARGPGARGGIDRVPP